MNFARFDAKLEQRVAALDAKIEQRYATLEAKLDQRIAEVRQSLADQRAELIKWMFLFWIGTVVPLAGLMVALNRL